MLATQKNRQIEILVPCEADVLVLLGFTVTEELGRPFIIEAEVASTENINFEDFLGENVSIRLSLAKGKQRYFNGFITSISQSRTEGRYKRYDVTIRPWLWFLTRTSDCRIFQNLTVPDIITQVCNEFRFCDIKNKLSPDYRIWEYCVQYRETSFNFISRLMEQEGIYYFFTHEKGRHWLNLADGLCSHEAIPGYKKIPYHPPDSTAVRDEEVIFGWFLSKKIQPGTYELNDYDFNRPRANLKVNSNIAKEHSEAEHEVYDYPGAYMESCDGEAYVRMRIEELQAMYEQGQGHGEARGLAYGSLFCLTGFPRNDQNREYLVVSVNHSIRVDDYDAFSSGRDAVPYTNDFTVITSNTPYRPMRITPKPVVQGPQTAVVVGPKKDGKYIEEIHTNEHGQVKLKFHWDRYGKADEKSSCWVRVSQVWAGKNWGGMHIPRVGQEVIVEFLEGDPDRPIVTGRVYNGEQKPPYDLPANKTQSGVKSRSTKDGTPNNFNELRFEDKKGKEEVYMHAERDLKTIVENDERREVHHNRMTLIGTKENKRPEETVEGKVAYGTRNHNVHGNDYLVVYDGVRFVEIRDKDHALEIEKGNNIVKVLRGNDSESIAGQKTISAGSIELIAGASSIKIEPSGITLNGPMIKLKGDLIDIEASVMLKEKAPMIVEEGTGMVLIKGGVVLIN